MSTTAPVQLVECPRDAMQGLPDFVPTALKIEYLNQLLRVGFHTLDCGSFVSPKAIPQLRDTAEVLAGLDLSETDTRLLVIVANARGARAAVRFPQVSYLGFPLSVSETFQQRNTNRSIEEALVTVADIQALCANHGQELVVYLSMAYGNPYGDPYSPAVVEALAERVVALGVRTLALADTVGSAAPESIAPLFETLIPRFPDVTFGAHLHATPAQAVAKLRAAYRAGCRRFDGALRGFGGCPMAADTLTGNVATETLLELFASPTDAAALRAALATSARVFG